MDRLAEILREEVTAYASDGVGVNVRLFALCDDQHKIYAVNAVDYPHYEEMADVVVMARIINNKIVIEHDATDKPLIEALLAREIPRDQIILAYEGEAIPDPVKLSL